MSDKIKLRLNPFSAVDMFYEQNWLEYMAKKGLLLKTCNLFTYKFEVGEPADRRYRILPYRHSKTTQEELDLYASCGWSLKYGPREAMIFYTDDPDVPEPFTDVQSQHKYYRNRFITNFAILLFLIGNLLFNIMRNSNGFSFSPSELLYRNADEPLSSVIVILAGLPLLLLLFLQYMFAYIEILNKIRKKDFYSASGFKFKYYFSAILLISMVVLLLCTIINIPVNFDYSTSGDFTQALKYKSNEIVRFSEFDPDTWSTVKKKIENYDEENNKTDIIFEIDQDKSFMIPRMVSENLELIKNDDKDDNSTVTLYYNVKLHKARSVKVASEFMNYDMKDVLKESNIKVADKSPDKFRFNYEGLDYAAYIVDEKKANDSTAKRDQLLFLRKGNTYVYVSYYGSIDLKSKVGLFADKM